MNTNRVERLGELFIILQALMWGMFPVLANKSNLPALLSAGICTLLSVLVLAPLAFKERIKWELINIYTLINLLITTLVLGFGFTALVFMANESSDPVTISILLLGEVPATFFILTLVGHEKLSFKQMFGGLLVVASSCFVILKGSLSTAESDLLVIVAVIATPLAHYYGKQLGRALTSTQILAFRNFVAGILLILVSRYLEPLPHRVELISSLPYLLPNAILVFGISKVLWQEGIFRLTIGKAASLNSIFPIVTMVGAYILIGSKPETRQILAVFPAILGVYLVTRIEPKIANNTREFNSSKKP